MKINRSHLVCMLMQILILKLMRAVLPAWDHYLDSSRVTEIAERLFSFLGTILIACATDMTLISPGD